MNLSDLNELKKKINYKEPEIELLHIEDTSKIEKLSLYNNGFYIVKEGKTQFLNPYFTKITFASNPYIIDCKTIYENYLKLKEDYPVELVFDLNSYKLGSITTMTTSDSSWYLITLSSYNLWNIDSFKFVLGHEISHIKYKEKKQNYDVPLVMIIIQSLIVAISSVIRLIALLLIVKAAINIGKHPEEALKLMFWIAYFVYFLVVSSLMKIANYLDKIDKWSDCLKKYHEEFWCDFNSYNMNDFDINLSKLFLYTTDIGHCETHPSNKSRIHNLKNKKTRSKPITLVLLTLISKPIMINCASMLKKEENAERRNY